MIDLLASSFDLSVLEAITYGVMLFGAGALCTLLTLGIFAIRPSSAVLEHQRKRAQWKRDIDEDMLTHLRQLENRGVYPKN